MQHVHRGAFTPCFLTEKERSKINVFFVPCLFFQMKKRSPKKQSLTIFKAATDTQLLIPFLEEGVKAGGFKSTAGIYAEPDIDLNDELIRNKPSTFFARVDGDCLSQSLIVDGDLVIIDKSLEPRDGCQVVAVVDGEFTLKTIKKGKGVIYLLPDNPEYQPITVTPDEQFLIWGVATYVIHKLY